MKCRKCAQTAAINMRHHKLALCRGHFLEWIPDYVQRSIEKYHMFHTDERILVAVSGGKDSLSLWDILSRLGYSADGLYLDLGIEGGNGYSDESKRLTEGFAASRGLNLIIVDVEADYGESIPEMAKHTLRGRGKPCAVCGLSKRHIMNRVAREGKFDVLVTGHNLDDEAAVLFGNTLHWQSGYLVRQWPVLQKTHPGLIRKAKPLCRIYEREMAAYALLSGIDYIYEECPHAVGSKSIYYKEILNKLEVDRPGTKLNFYLSFLQAKERGLFTPQADPYADQLHDCPHCGQPTSAPDECVFCRMVLQVQASSR